MPITSGVSASGLPGPTSRASCATPTSSAWKDRELTLIDQGIDEPARSACLARTAAALHGAGLLTGWRDELLAVRGSARGPVLAAIERSACRPLGIATTAVHLNAYADDGDVVVARRAAHKQIDPGCWDNLVGGMVPYGESLELALEREAWEEAGIELDRIEVHHGRAFQLLRPVPEGVQSETIHVYDAALAAATVPRNQDGEVDRIENALGRRRRRSDRTRRVHARVGTGDHRVADAPRGIPTTPGLYLYPDAGPPMLDPVVLFFVLGVAARLAKSDLRLPEALYEALAIYLLLAIGLKGGVELARQPSAVGAAARAGRDRAERGDPARALSDPARARPAVAAPTARRSPRTTARCRS